MARRANEETSGNNRREEFNRKKVIRVTICIEVAKWPNTVNTNIRRTEDKECINCGNRGHMDQVCYEVIRCEIWKYWGSHIHKMAKALRETAKLQVKHELSIEA